MFFLAWPDFYEAQKWKRSHRTESVGRRRPNPGWWHLPGIMPVSSAGIQVCHHLAQASLAFLHGWSGQTMGSRTLECWGTGYSGEIWSWRAQSVPASGNSESCLCGLGKQVWIGSHARRQAATSSSTFSSPTPMPGRLLLTLVMNTSSFLFSSSSHPHPRAHNGGGWRPEWKGWAELECTQNIFLRQAQVVG